MLSNRLLATIEELPKTVSARLDISQSILQQNKEIFSSLKTEILSVQQTVQANISKDVNGVSENLFLDKQAEIANNIEQLQIKINNIEHKLTQAASPVTAKAKAIITKEKLPFKILGVNFIGNDKCLEVLHNNDRDLLLAGDSKQGWQLLKIFQHNEDLMASLKKGNQQLDVKVGK